MPDIPDIPEIIVLSVVAAGVWSGWGLFCVAKWLVAKPCPRCRSEWHTRCVADWWGWELWRCRKCKHVWEVNS